MVLCVSVSVNVNSLSHLYIWFLLLIVFFLFKFTLFICYLHSCVILFLAEFPDYSTNASFDFIDFFFNLWFVSMYLFFFVI